MIYIYPYKMYSESAKALRNGLSSSLRYRVKLVKPDGRFNPRRRDTVINWGNTSNPSWEFDDSRDLNPVAAVEKAVNKLDTFDTLSNDEIRIPEYTIHREVAQEWLNEGKLVVARALLRGHSGNGITLHGGEFTNPLPHVPLYVQYKKKRAEYRVHVFQGNVIDTVQKKKRNQAERPETFNTFIRNHGNGWVYCRDGITPDRLRDLTAIASMDALGLDFGAVDIIFNEHENKYYVLEVNTAPGLEGTTLQKYIERFTQL